MKMLKILPVILSLIISLVAYSQTTLEEYNYITKGYKIQLESGLDMKKGYTIKNIIEPWTYSNTKQGQVRRKTKIKGLYRYNETKPCAIMVVYKREDNGFTDYICIPHKDSSEEIWNMYFKKITKYQKEGATALIWGISKAMAHFAKF